MGLDQANAAIQGQDWVATAIELLVVIIGVFLGTWVANWNQARLDRGNTLRLLSRFKSEFDYQFDQYERLKAYLATTDNYASMALRGWRNDPEVTDSQFVIAAYQASQATGSTTNTQTWASIFGSAHVQNITDSNLRDRLIRVLSIDSALTDYRQIQSAYRENVRHVIPDEIQARIRERCGDQVRGDSTAIYYLPPRCDLELPADQAKAVAAALRSHSELIADLNWHKALVATMLSNWEMYVAALRRLSDAIEAHSGGRQS